MRQTLYQLSYIPQAFLLFISQDYTEGTRHREVGERDLYVSQFIPGNTQPSLYSATLLGYTRTQLTTPRGMGAAVSAKATNIENNQMSGKLKDSVEEMLTLKMNLGVWGG